MTTTPAELGDDSVSLALHNQYVRQVRHVADWLRRLADEVERDGLDVRVAPVSRDPHLDYAYNATRVVHAVTWGLAHTNVDSVVSAAAEVDRYLREPKGTETNG